MNSPSYKAPFGVGYVNKLLYYTAIILGALIFMLIIGVAVFKEYSLRQPMLYIALAGIAVLVVERITTWKLQKQDVA